MKLKAGDHFDCVLLELFQRINTAANGQGLVALISKIEGDPPLRFLTFTLIDEREPCAKLDTDQSETLT